MKETLVRLKVLLTTGRVRQLAHFARDRLAEINIAEVASSMALATLLAIVPVLALSLAVFAAFPSFSGAEKMKTAERTAKRAFIRTAPAARSFAFFISNVIYKINNYYLS